MSCALCAIRENCQPSSLHLIPATEDMTVLLAGILSEHRIPFERRHNVFALDNPTPDDPTPDKPGGHERLIALLRQVLSEPERRDVSVFAGEVSGRFPTTHSLDEWWRIHQTAWFSDALANDRFETWFQPIVDTGSNKILAHECLIRLNAGRLYSGGEIIDAARTRNEIHAFDSYARRLAIRSAAKQSATGKYFVNFMPSSIYNPEHCMKSTLEALSESGILPESIVFEVVESDLVRNSAHLRNICDYYRRHGFGFALDDVGTGANSLQMVCDLHPDYIKLDKSLIDKVEQPMYAATIGKLVELAGQFGVSVIAEGVEKPETMENLWLLGVHRMQGYFFGRPSPRITRQTPEVQRPDASLADAATHQMLDPDLVNLSRSLSAACELAGQTVSPR